MSHDNDPRFTAGLQFDVCELLERHGYKQHADVRTHADVMVALLRLVEAFEGVERASIAAPDFVEQLRMIREAAEGAGVKLR